MLKEKVEKWFASPQWIALAALLVLLACILPANFLMQFIDDKLAHIVSFGALAYWWLKYSDKYIMVVLVVSMFGLSIEFIQLWLSTLTERSFDISDWLADTVGAIVAALYHIIKYLYENK